MNDKTNCKFIETSLKESLDVEPNYYDLGNLETYGYDSEYTEFIDGTGFRDIDSVLNKLKLIPFRVVDVGEDIDFDESKYLIKIEEDNKIYYFTKKYSEMKYAEDSEVVSSVKFNIERDEMIDEGSFCRIYKLCIVDSEIVAVESDYTGGQIIKFSDSQGNLEIELKFEIN